jgi:hypothetical protein
VRRERSREYGRVCINVRIGSVLAQTTKRQAERREKHSLKKLKRWFNFLAEESSLTD